MTILPTVMPDEFVLGYWGRVHILNFLGTPTQTVEALIDYFALPPSRTQRITSANSFLRRANSNSASVMGF